jgi:hypothetical protein
MTRAAPAVSLQLPLFRKEAAVSRRIAAIALAGLSFALAAQEAQRPARVGDVHVYSAEMKTERKRYEEKVTVTAIEGERIRTQHVRSDRPDPTQGIYARDWATVLSGNSGAAFEPAMKVLGPLEVGRGWESVHEVKNAAGALSRLKLESTVVAREKLATPAGEFDTWRIDSKGYLSGLSWQGGWGISQKVWYAPAIDRVVRFEYREQRSMGTDNVVELKAFLPAP